MKETKSRPTRILTAIDVFSGSGGMTKGIFDAGFEVLAAIELNPLRASTYQLNHRAVVMFNQDVRSVSKKHLLADVPMLTNGLDLLAACPPCQGFSRIRRRNGKRAAADDRNSLVLEVARLARELNPRAIVLENVPGLELDSRFATVVEDLSTMGYSLDWGVLDAKQFGVPQRRKRVVLIASLGNVAPQLELVPKLPIRTVRDTIEVLPTLHARARELHDRKSKRSAIVSRRIRATPKDGGSRDSWPPELELACHRGKKVFRDVYGRMAWDEPAPTITGGCNNPSKGRFLHPTENRAISLVEAAMLQSFPASYRYPERATAGQIAEMIGEAVPPRFARQLAGYVRDSLL